MSWHGQFEEDVVDAGLVEDEVKDHLEKWLPTYVADMADKRGLPRDTWIRKNPNPPHEAIILDNGRLSVVGTWTFSTEFIVEDTTALPAILIMNAGLSEPPIMEGDGSYRAKWIIGIGGLVSAGGDNPPMNSSRLAKRFGSVIARIMLQANWDSTNLEGISWEDEGYDDVDDKSRTMGSFRLVFEIEYRNVLNANMGPAEPDPVPDPVPDDSYPDWGTVPDADHIHVDIQREPLT
jgi:hypothetical protein